MQRHPPFKKSSEILIRTDLMHVCQVTYYNAKLVIDVAQSLTMKIFDGWKRWLKSKYDRELYRVE